jgi:hypothetical protein
MRRRAQGPVECCILAQLSHIPAPSRRMPATQETPWPTFDTPQWPVFVTIPKTGSTSVTRMLRNAFWDQPALYVPATGSERDRVLELPQKRFSRYGVYRGFLSVDYARERVPNPFIFTFLREPAAHVVSLYYYNRYRGRAPLSLAETLEGGGADNTIRAMLRQRTQEDRKVYEWALQHAS